MHPVLGKFPNKYTYNSELRDGPATQNRKLNKKLGQFLREYLQVDQSGEEHLRLSVIDVPQGVC